VIRPARVADLDALEVLLLRAAERAAFTRLDVPRARRTLAEYIVHRGCFSMVSDDVGGALFGRIGTPWYGHTRTASELFFYAEDGSGGWLLRRFLRWAREQQAEAVFMVSSTGINPERAARLYEGLGLPQVGTVHRGAI